MPANMKPVVVPKTVLALVRSANTTVDTPTHKPTQVIKITLADSTVKELVKSARNGGKGAKLTFGKTPVCRCSQLPAEIMFPMLSRVIRHSTTGPRPNVSRPNLSLPYRSFTVPRPTAKTNLHWPVLSVTSWRL